MRRSLILVALLAVTAACGAPRHEESEAPAGPTSESAAGAPQAAEDRASGPDIAPTAAPGVAFNYSYAFRLPAERLAEVQEQHAAMCEQLGPERCRITGMHYEVLGERDIRGRLNLGLEPSIARRVGREGVAAVLRAEGSLVESEISGTDVGTGIRRAGRTIAQMQEELRRIEPRLAGRVADAERSDLEYQAQQLREQIRASQETRQDAQDSLATTPMTFTYGSGDLVPGADGRRPVGRILEEAGDRFLDGATVLLIILVTLGPWALLAGLVLWLVRWGRRRWGRPGAPASDVEATSPRT